MQATAATFPISAIRSQFPALSLRDDLVDRIYFDSPAGTQVPTAVASAVSRFMLTSNANLGAAFRTSQEALEAVHGARVAMARLFGVDDPSEIVFGSSMTALTFAVSRSFANRLQPGDQIIVSRMDHDANVAPWLAIAQDRGAEIRWLPHNLETWQLSVAELDQLLTKRTKLVALTCASNLTGSINDVRAFADRVHAAGSLLYVDAVQYAPHRRMQVADWDCDFAVCSAYKIYGPHVGLLWGKKSILEELTAYKVRPSASEVPWRFEQGTPQIELLASLAEVLKHFEWIGGMFTSSANPSQRLSAAFEAVQAWEDDLTRQLIEGLSRIRGIRVLGITDAQSLHLRVPTVSFVHDAVSPAKIARQLAQCNVFVWNGYNYALELIRSLGIDERTGVVRVGLAHYNAPDEITWFLSLLSDLYGALR